MSLVVPTTASNIPTWIRLAATAINQKSRRLNVKETTVTATYTLEDDYDVIKADTTAAAFTITLPKAGLHQGRVVHFKRIDASANNLMIDGDGSETIDGATTVALTAQWETRSLVSDGSNWLLL